MGALMRSSDWARTPFGPVADWPQSLRTAISIMLESRFAMVVAWGPEFRFFYNDRYRPILGTKHPAALGARAARSFPKSGRSSAPSSSGCGAARRSPSTTGCCRSIETATWRTAGSRCRTARSATKRAASAACWPSWRRPPAAWKASGGSRRCAIWRGARPMPTTPEHACRNAGEVFDANPIDVPFALIYLLEADGAVARLVSRVGIAADHAASVETVRLASSAGDVWRLADVIQTGRTIVHSDLQRQVGALPGGPYDEHSHTAVLLPLSRPGLQHPYGVLVAGVSPRRALDDRYRDFFELAADHIATGHQQRRGARRSAAPRGSAGRNRSGEDRVLQQRQPRVPHAADLDARTRPRISCPARTVR